MFANKIEIKESFLSVMKQVDVLSKELQVLSLIRLPRDTLKSLINELKEQKTQHRDINPDNLQKENQQVIKDILVASNYFSIQGCKERTEKTQDVLNQLQKLSNILTNLEKADKINSIRQIIEK